MIGDRCLRVAHHAFILFLVVATAAVLSAQTVVDPRFVEFSPSANHNTNASDGTPLVQRYSLSVYVVGSSAAFDTMDLGKPTPSGGVIRVDFLPLIISCRPPASCSRRGSPRLVPAVQRPAPCRTDFRSSQRARRRSTRPGSRLVPAGRRAAWA